MKSKVFIILVVILPIRSLSQIEFSKDFKYEVGEPYSKSVGNLIRLTNKTIALKIDKNGLTLSTYHRDNLQPSRQDIYKEFKKSDDYYYLKIKNKHYLCFKSYNKNTESFEAFYRELDTNECILQRKIVLFKSDSHISVRNFEFVKCSDDSKILLHFLSVPRRDKYYLVPEKTTSHFYVYDMNFEKIWNRSLLIPYSGNISSEIGWSLRNDGKAYLMISVKSLEKKGIKPTMGQSVRHSELFLIDAELNDPVRIELNFEDELKGNGQFFAVPDGFLFTGIYKSGNHLQEYLFIRKFNSDHEILIDKTFNLFGIMKDFNVDFNDSKYKCGWTPGPFRLRNVELLNNGALVFFAHKFDVKISGYSIHTSSQNIKTDVHYGNGLMLKVDSVGEMLWMQVLPRCRKETRHNEENVRARNFSYQIGSSPHLVFFVDDNEKKSVLGKSKHRDPDQQLSDLSSIEGIFSVYSIDDETGHLEKHHIFNLSNNAGLGIRYYDANQFTKTSNDIYITEMLNSRRKRVLISISRK
jgi:diaminopimelate epimerase